MEKVHEATLSEKEIIRQELIKDGECQVCGKHNETVENRFCPDCREAHEKDMAVFAYEQAKADIGRLYAIDFIEIAKAEKTPWMDSDAFVFFLHDLAEENGNAILIADVASYPHKYIDLFVKWWRINRMEESERA